MSEYSKSGLLLADDLLFTSRITTTARALGLDVKLAGNAEALKNQAEQSQPSCVMVDLAYPGVPVNELVTWLKQTVIPPPFVVAYGSHVDTNRLQAATDAGCDVVLPRSKFVECLPEMLPAWLEGKSTKH